MKTIKTSSGGKKMSNHGTHSQGKWMANTGTFSSKTQPMPKCQTHSKGSKKRG